MGKQKRRAFLRNSVMAGLLAPVVGYWDDLVEAQPMMDRRNMVLVFLPNGKVAGNDYLLGSGMGYTFAYGYEPYQPFQGDAIVFDEYGFQSFIREEYDGDHSGHVAPGAVMYSGEVPYTTSAGAGEDMMALRGAARVDVGGRTAGPAPRAFSCAGRTCAGDGRLR